MSAKDQLRPTSSAQATRFPSGDTTCDAWFFSADGGAQGPATPRPVVIMAHGFGGTKDSGLAPFAESLVAAGLHVLAFDYRGFGASGGSPRQIVSPAAQLADYRAAMDAARGMPGVDAARLVLWGESLSAGTVIAAATDRDDVAAVISLVPLLDGLAAMRQAATSVSRRSMLLSGLYGMADLIAGRLRRPPVLMPLVAEPGRAGALTLPGFRADYLAIAGPTWRNEVAARIALDIARFRPSRLVRRLRSPWLVQIADFDRAAPPQSAARAAARGRAEVHHYPCDHFDVQPGRQWHAKAVADQVAFLTRHLGPILPTAAAPKTSGRARATRARG